MSDIQIKSPRWMKIALAISVCLNLLVLGAVGGAILSGESKKHRTVTSSDPVRGIYRALPSDVRKSLRQNSRAKGPSRKERQVWVADFVAALRATNFDAGTLEPLFAARQARVISITGNAQDALIKAISELSPDARLKLADDFEQGTKRFMRSKKDK